MNKIASELLWEPLAAWGVDAVFGLPGVALINTAHNLAAAVASRRTA